MTSRLLNADICFSMNSECNVIAQNGMVNSEGGRYCIIFKLPTYSQPNFLTYTLFPGFRCLVGGNWM